MTQSPMDVIKSYVFHNVNCEAKTQMANPIYSLHRNPQTMVASVTEPGNSFSRYTVVYTWYTHFGRPTLCAHMWRSLINEKISKCRLTLWRRKFSKLIKIRFYNVSGNEPTNTFYSWLPLSLFVKIGIEKFRRGV